MSPFLGSACRPGEAIYDLYSVINHHGNILGGHYTAYGCCSDDGDGGGDNAGMLICIHDVIGERGGAMYFKTLRTKFSRQNVSDTKPVTTLSPRQNLADNPPPLDKTASNKLLMIIYNS